MDNIVKQYNLLNVTFKKNGSVASYTVNEEKKDAMLQTAGFFASKTVGVDFTPLEAMDNYGMRDEQEKCFGMQKRPLGQDRLHTWSETAKHGRMFICFIGLILARMFARSTSRTSICGPSSLPSRTSLPRCVPSAALSTRAGSSSSHRS